MLELDDSLFRSLLNSPAAGNGNSTNRVDDWDLRLMQSLWPLIGKGLEALMIQLENGSKKIDPLVWLAQYIIRNKPEKFRVENVMQSHLSNIDAAEWRRWHELVDAEQGRRDILRCREIVQRVFEGFMTRRVVKVTAIPKVLASIDLELMLEGDLVARTAMLPPIVADAQSTSTVDFGAFWNWFRSLAIAGSSLRAGKARRDAVEGAKRREEAKKVAAAEEKVRRDAEIRAAIEAFESFGKAVASDHQLARIIEKDHMLTGSTVKSVMGTTGGAYVITLAGSPTGAPPARRPSGAGLQRQMSQLQRPSQIFGEPSRQTGTAMARQGSSALNRAGSTASMGLMRMSSKLDFGPMSEEDDEIAISGKHVELMEKLLALLGFACSDVLTQAEVKHISLALQRRASTLPAPQRRQRGAARGGGGTKPGITGRLSVGAIPSVILTWANPPPAEPVPVITAEGEKPPTPPIHKWTVSLMKKWALVQKVLGLSNQDGIVDRESLAAVLDPATFIETRQLVCEEVDRGPASGGDATENTSVVDAQETRSNEDEGKPSMEALAQTSGISLIRLEWLHEQFESLLPGGKDDYPANPEALSRKQMRDLITDLQPDIRDEEFDAKFDQIDSDGSGQIEFDEFVGWMAQDKLDIGEEEN